MCSSVKRVVVLLESITGSITVAKWTNHTSSFRLTQTCSGPLRSWHIIIEDCSVVNC